MCSLNPKPYTLNPNGHSGRRALSIEFGVVSGFSGSEFRVVLYGRGLFSVEFRHQIQP